MNREFVKDECLRVAQDQNEFLRMIGEKPLDDQPIAEIPNPKGERALARR
jgi:hypothetical protein